MNQFAKAIAERVSEWEATLTAWWQSGLIQDVLLSASMGLAAIIVLRVLIRGLLLKKTRRERQPPPAMPRRRL